MAPFNTISPNQAKFVLETLFEYAKKQPEGFSAEMVMLLQHFIPCMERDFRTYSKNDPQSSIKSGIDYCENIEGPLDYEKKILFLNQFEHLFKNWLILEEMPGYLRLSYLDFLSLNCQMPLAKYNELLIASKNNY